VAGTTLMAAAAVARTSTGLGHELRAIRMVWRRELIGFWRNRLRVVIALVQPLLFLFVLGTGISSIARSPGGDVSFRTFMFPGVVAMTVLFPALFSAGSIVFDREFGFLREMLVAPIRRGSIVIGKCLGGATVAAAQGAIVLLLAGLVNVPYAPLMLLTVVGELLLLSFALVSFGVMAAARIRQFQSFQAVVQIAMLPMVFLSGAMFPLSGLPAWLAVVTRLDPITYAVDPLRRAVFSHLQVSEITLRAFDPGVTWFGWRVPTGVELAIVATMGVAMLGVAIDQFRRVE
jgi:ABC-2 type transport system permease protein